jgi:hypothetical protein
MSLQPITKRLYVQFEEVTFSNQGLRRSEVWSLITGLFLCLNKVACRKRKVYDDDEFAQPADIKAPDVAHKSYSYVRQAHKTVSR